MPQKNQNLIDLLKGIEFVLRKRNLKRFIFYEVARKRFVDHLPEKIHGYFHFIADIGLIEGLICQEYYDDVDTGYNSFLASIHRAIRQSGNRITASLVKQYEGALEQMIIDLYDTLACITAKRKDGQIDFNSEDGVYQIFEKELDSWVFDKKPEAGTYHYSENVAIEKSLEFYSADMLWTDLSFMNYYCVKYIRPK